MKYIGIYKILNLKNKKVYIGSSTDLKQRLRTHKYQLKENKHGNTHLQASFNKYGKDNFLCEIIEITSKENLIEREIYWINYYQSLNRKKGYNKSSNIQSNSGHKWSEESKKRLSESKKGKPCHPNVKAALAKARSERIYDTRYLHKEDVVRKRSETRKTVILQYNLEGDFIKEWKSATDAHLELKLQLEGIAACCRGLRFHCGNFQWFKKPKNNIFPLKISKYKRCSKIKNINEFMTLCSVMSIEKLGELLENPEEDNQQPS